MTFKTKFLRQVVLVIALTGSATLWAQKEPIRQVYSYTVNNNRDLVKAKTDLFLLNVLASKKFTMKTNSSGDDHLDVNIMTQYNKGEISTRVRYDFLQEGYVVSLSNTQILAKNKEAILVDDPKNKAHKSLLDQLEKLFFRTYENEIGKS